MTHMSALQPYPRLDLDRTEYVYGTARLLGGEIVHAEAWSM
jgi:hypothetical protein